MQMMINSKRAEVHSPALLLANIERFYEIYALSYQIQRNFLYVDGQKKFPLFHVTAVCKYSILCISKIVNRKNICSDNLHTYVIRVL